MREHLCRRAGFRWGCLWTILVATSATADQPDDVVLGAIGGEPVHLSEVLNDCREQLDALDRDAPYYKEYVRQSVHRTVQKLLLDRLAVRDAVESYGEAYEADRAKFAAALRARLVDDWGDGDPEQADRLIRERSGKGLEETVEETWQRTIVTERLRALGGDDLAVPREAVRAEYDRTIEQYREPEQRAITILSIRGTEVAGDVDAAIASGVSFEDIADEHAGRLVTRSVAHGDLVGPLDDALRALSPGEHSPPVPLEERVCWVRLDHVEPEVIVTFAEAAPGIERAMQQTRWTEIRNAHVRMLMEREDYTPIPELTSRAIRAVLSAERVGLAPDR